MIPQLNKIAVLGSGVMGSQIAAHFANAGNETLLFGLNPDETKHDSAAYAIAQLKKIKPLPISSIHSLHYLTAANYEHDCESLTHCDLVIEAVSEDIEIKRSVYQRITPHLNQNTLIGSNTSGLPIETLASFLPRGLRPNFCGIHFFNPPRYLPLIELTPATQTSSVTLDTLEDWLTIKLGKHIVRTKDTAGFIANRFGVFALMSALQHGERLRFAPDLIDELTGKLIRRPKSATFRTLDLVGLDILVELSRHLHEKLVDDPWREYFVLPKWINALVKQGCLGQKTNKGIYRKNADNIEVYDSTENDYRPRRKTLDSSLEQIMKMNDPQQFQTLLESKHPQADFLYATQCDLFRYAAYHAQSTSHTIQDIDNAMRWGFGWERGIFEQWERIGWQEVITQIQHAPETELSIAADLPEWAVDKTRKSVFTSAGVWSPEMNDYISPAQRKIYQRQSGHQLGGNVIGTTITEDDNARIWHSDEIVIISFKTKLHSLNYDLICQLNQAITLAEASYKGLIIWNQQPPFCAGANLLEILLAAKVGKFSKNKLTSRIKETSLHLLKPDLPDISKLPPVDNIISYLQQTFMRMRNCHIPIVAAVEGMALGGGCEMLLHCDKVVAALESYIGLVEIGVGVLPAGGGCKEMAARAVHDAKGGDLFPHISRYYEQIAKAQVSTSAVNAKELGYLRDLDVIVMNPYELLYIAKQQVCAMHASIYRPPHPMQYLKTAGSTAAANLQALLTNLREGKYISEYDYHIATKIGEVICGSPFVNNEEVSAQWYLDQERKAFISLLKQSKTQDRIEYMLKNGKPLRN